jgi:hypothetical protein
MRSLQQMDQYDTILGFCQHGKSVVMIINMPCMRADVRKLSTDPRYREIKKVSAEEGRKSFDGICEECKALRTVLEPTS